jgi:DNA-binding NarL/FixJ family response regulator
LTFGVNTLVICDPEPVAMEGLRSLLETTEGLRVVATETNLEDAAGAISELQPDLVILDQTFGCSAVERFLGQPDCMAAVIVWGGCLSETQAIHFLQSGVAGVVSKTASLHDIEECIRSVASGRRWMDDIAPSKYVQ